MIWHSVRFDMRHLAAAVRPEVEASPAERGRRDEVAWLCVARDLEVPAVRHDVATDDDPTALP